MLNGGKRGLASSMWRLRLCSFGFETTLVFVAALVVFFSASSSSARADEELGSGGPYVGTGRGLQKFVAKIAKVDSERRVKITFFNGFGSKPGFRFVRVFLTNQALQTSSEPTGYVLADERTFAIKNTHAVDLTGHLNSNDLSLVIEAEGVRGAQLSWVLEGSRGPMLSPLNPTTSLSGRTILLHGDNFSSDPSENTVTFNGQPGRVLASTRSTLTVIPPSNVDSGNATISVKVNGQVSNIHNMGMNPTPILTSIYPDGGPPGEILTIYGRNFARPPQANVVFLGPFRATVLGATDTALRCEIPNWGFASQGLPVSVTADGVPSRNNLIFYPNPHIFINGSAF